MGRNNLNAVMKRLNNCMWSTVTWLWADHGHHICRNINSETLICRLPWVHNPNFFRYLRHNKTSWPCKGYRGSAVYYVTCQLQQQSVCNIMLWINTYLQSPLYDSAAPVHLSIVLMWFVQCWERRLMCKLLLQKFVALQWKQTQIHSLWHCHQHLLCCRD